MREMSSRERTLAAINHEPCDRVPTDIWATEEVLDKLRKRFGSDEELRKALHIDGTTWISPQYAGPPLPKFPDGSFTDYWGMSFKPVKYADGTYGEQTVFPLSNAKSIADLEAYKWPTTDLFDYKEFRRTVESERRTKVVAVGFMMPFYWHNTLRGLELSMMDPLVDPEFTHYLLKRLCDFLYEHHLRIFETCEGLIDLAHVTDDLGCQTGPLISMEIFREFYVPYYKRFIGLCREFGIKVFHHDDGAIRPFLPELVEMGIDVLNPVQWSCPNMDMKELKAEFGKKICFHGAVENQRILPFGTEEEVRAEVRHCIDSLASDGTGYILASCHNLQPNTPIENIIAMYDEAWKYGRF
jgi:uroporphyrinogen decarboxylase